jgi:hypothetical protein
MTRIFADGAATNIGRGGGKSAIRNPKLASQARHDMGAPKVTFASRIVVETNSKFQLNKARKGEGFSANFREFSLIGTKIGTRNSRTWLSALRDGLASANFREPSRMQTRVFFASYRQRLSTVTVIGGAGAFGGDHGGAQRMLRGAAVAKRRALVRFDSALQDQSAEAF